jgi:hypothetical protein
MSRSDMKKGKSKKAFARKNVIRNQKRQGHPFNNKAYDIHKYDGSDPDSPEVVPV